MAVNLRPHSTQAPLWVEEPEYQQLVKRAQGGWSRCEDETEWLAKLHYLRSGLREGKLSEEQFGEREQRLVLGWLNKRI